MLIIRQSSETLTAKYHITHLNTGQSSIRFTVFSGGALERDALVNWAPAFEAAAKATPDYVRANPWKVVGITAAVALVLGILLARR